MATEKNITDEIDKCITLKVKKEGARNKTYCHGFDDFIEKHEDFCKKIKKTIGTGCTKIEDNGKIIYVFQGDCVERINDFLVKKGIQSEKIKK